MAIKDLLVSYNASENAESALSLAIQKCQKYGAALTGLYVSSPIRFEGHIAHWITQDTLEALQTTEDKVAESIQEAFFKCVGEKGFSGKVEWITRQGRPTDILIQQSRYFDLMLLGQQSTTKETKHHIRAEDIVTRSGKPLLVVPAAYECHAFSEYAVVAWDGSRAAARALTDAMQILETKKRLDVLTIKSDKADKTDSPDDMDIIRHIQRHGVDASRVVLQASRDGKGATILDYCAQNQPDILVTGAYGHSRLREDLLGGVTNDIMQHMNIPVFMSH